MQSAFGGLGYPTLEEACARSGGFVVDDLPNTVENQCFAVLESLICALYDGFFLQETMPQRKVIRNSRAAYHGMATVYRIRKGEINTRGLAIRYEVVEIYLKESIFTESGYFDAVSTYIHESCHAFGGDSSDAFSCALTNAMEILLSRSDLVEEYRKAWSAVFASCATRCG